MLTGWSGNEQECYPFQNANPSGPNATVEAFRAVVAAFDHPHCPRPIAMNDNGLKDGPDLDIAGWGVSLLRVGLLAQRLAVAVSIALSICRSIDRSIYLCRGALIAHAPGHTRAALASRPYTPKIPPCRSFSPSAVLARLHEVTSLVSHACKVRTHRGCYRMSQAL